METIDTYTFCTVQPTVPFQGVQASLNMLSSVLVEIFENNSEGIDFLLLPEHFCRADEIGGLVPLDHVIEFFEQLTQKHSVNIIGGSVETLDENKQRVNRCFIINRNGKIIGTYDKQKTLFFERMREVQRGMNPTILSLDGLRFAVEICADLWFPELSRSLIEKEVDALFVPAMTTVMSKDHTDYGRWLWHNLAVTRARENIIPLIVSDHALAYHEGYFATCGASCIVDPSVRFTNAQGPSFQAFKSLSHGEKGRIISAINLTKIQDYRDYRKEMGLL
ncbi:MAG: carbon-nitrogen hydrolase family protein [Candidatus Hermodarchaeota archaeon]